MGGVVGKKKKLIELRPLDRWFNQSNSDPTSIRFLKLYVAISAACGGLAVRASKCCTIKKNLGLNLCL